jgi:arabinofuranan 3-O-arabinosyltransferase
MRRWFEPVLAGLCLGYVLTLALLWAHGQWILDAGGHPQVVDFLSFYAAGWLADHGRALAAYDWRAMHAFHQTMIGGSFSGFFGWAYPPLFFPPVMILALAPYGLAFGLWVLASLALLAWLLWRIGGRGAVLLGLALPPVLANAIVGQNGFLTAALFAGALLALPRKPLLAGVLIALLTYKPHFGILIPVALVAGGHWRALVAAMVLVLLYAAGCWLLAPDLARAFLHNLIQNNGMFLASGASGFFKLQSLYGMLRTLGVPFLAAWSAQVALAIGTAVLVALLWHRHTAFAVKAAALCVGAVLALPYVYFYDLPLLAVALAFLSRERAFETRELMAIGAMILSLGLCAVVVAPLGFVAVAISAGLVARRAL